MTNKFKMGVASLVAGVSAVLLPLVASADTFGTSTVASVQNTMVGDVAVIIGATVGVILGLYSALTGLGWARRKFSHYVSGRKF